MKLRIGNDMATGVNIAEPKQRGRNSERDDDDKLAKVITDAWTLAFHVSVRKKVVDFHEGDSQVENRN